MGRDARIRVVGGVGGGNSKGPGGGGVSGGMGGPRPDMSFGPDPVDRFNRPIGEGDGVLYKPNFDLVFTVAKVERSSGLSLDPSSPPQPPSVTLHLQVSVPLQVPPGVPLLNIVLVQKEIPQTDHQAAEDQGGVGGDPANPGENASAVPSTEPVVGADAGAESEKPAETVPESGVTGPDLGTMELPDGKTH